MGKYAPAYPVLASTILREERDIFAKYGLWPANGTYVRNPRGERFTRVSEKGRRIHYLLETDHGRHSGFITDKLIVDRVVEYMECYHGKKHTNCSSFAHFLTTGTFVECSDDHRALVIEQGMRVYAGQKIAIGDMVCIFFARENFMESRKTLMRPDYMKMKKQRHMDEKFGCSLATTRQVFTAQDIRRFHGDVRVGDFHFLVCVAKYNGEPVWISQRGRFLPGEATTPVVLTVGMHEGYADDMLLVTLLKKRR